MNLKKLKLPSHVNDVETTIPQGKYLSESILLKKHLSTNNSFFINAPTGSGKTIAILKYHTEAYLNNDNRNIFFIVPNRVTANQLINEYKHQQIYKNNILTIACPQTFNTTQIKERYDNNKDNSIIYVDESHQIAQDNFRDYDIFRQIIQSDITIRHISATNILIPRTDPPMYTFKIYDNNKRNKIINYELIIDTKKSLAFNVDYIPLIQHKLGQTFLDTLILGGFECKQIDQRIKQGWWGYTSVIAKTTPMYMQLQKKLQKQDISEQQFEFEVSKLQNEFDFVRQNIPTNIYTHKAITADKPTIQGRVLITNLLNAGFSLYNKKILVIINVAKYNKKISILQQLPNRFRGGQVHVVYVRSKHSTIETNIDQIIQIYKSDVIQPLKGKKRDKYLNVNGQFTNISKTMQLSNMLMDNTNPADIIDYIAPQRITFELNLPKRKGQSKTNHTQKSLKKEFEIMQNIKINYEIDDVRTVSRKACSVMRLYNSLEEADRNKLQMGNMDYIDVHGERVKHPGMVCCIAIVLQGRDISLQLQKNMSLLYDIRSLDGLDIRLTPFKKIIKKIYSYYPIIQSNRTDKNIVFKMIKRTIQALGGKIDRKTHEVVSKYCQYLDNRLQGKYADVFIDVRDSYELNIGYEKFKEKNKVRVGRRFKPFDLKGYLRSKGMIIQYMSLVDMPTKLSQYMVLDRTQWLQVIPNSSKYGGRQFTKYTSASDLVNGLKQNTYDQKFYKYDMKSAHANFVALILKYTVDKNIKHFNYSNWRQLGFESRNSYKIHMLSAINKKEWHYKYYQNPVLKGIGLSIERPNSWVVVNKARKNTSCYTFCELLIQDLKAYENNLNQQQLLQSRHIQKALQMIVNKQILANNKHGQIDSRTYLGFICTVLQSYERNNIKTHMGIRYITNKHDCVISNIEYGVDNIEAHSAFKSCIRYELQDNANTIIKRCFNKIKQVKSNPVKTDYPDLDILLNHAAKAIKLN